MRRLVLALLVIVAAGFAGFWWFWLRWSGISGQEVIAVRVQPVPEGPTMQFTLHSAPSLRLIERYIPDPLPAPGVQTPFCASGVDVVVTLKDGRKITYGPCHRPASIDALRAEMAHVMIFYQQTT
jgi:hypothetical protein